MLQKLKKLQEIITIIAINNDNELKEEGLKIINEVGRNHINDKFTITENKEGTILDCLILCDSQNKVRLNNSTLKELESAIIQFGGKQKISKCNVEEMNPNPNSILVTFLSVEDLRPRANEILVLNLEFAPLLILQV